jgi:dTDP-4-amino-4,6-dideoxygalactose transaminase
MSIQLFSNSLGAEELDAVKKVFDSKWLFHGKEQNLFEKNFGNKIKSKKFLFTNGCTNSIHMCLQALGIKQGDEVIMPSNSFISCPASVKMLGGTPVFCDIEKETNNIDINSCKEKITKKTKAVIILHYGGYPCKFDELKEIVKDIPIIEDSANSTYSLYKGRVCGTLGTFGCFSFDAMKMICCGEGGGISVNDTKYIDKLLKFRFLGLPPRASGVDKSKNENIWWTREPDCYGIKHVSCDIQAAIMNVQLTKLDSFIERRNEVTTLYNQILSNNKYVTLQKQNDKDFISNHYLYWIKVDKKYRNNLINYLKDNGSIYCTVKYWPLHLTKLYNDNQTYTNVEEMIDTIINLPIHQNIKDEDVILICKIINDFFMKYI